MRVFLGMQISGETVGEVRPVADMHQRKAEMARQSDAFIALPGNKPRSITHAAALRFYCFMEYYKYHRR